MKAVRKGGRVVCGGIHMTDLPQFRIVCSGATRGLSVANLTRRDAAEFMAIAPKAGIRTITRRYALDRANEALDDLRAGLVQGAAVLLP